MVDQGEKQGADTTRRRYLVALVVGGAVVGAGAVGLLFSRRSREQANPPPDPDALRLLGDLRGRQFATCTFVDFAKMPGAIRLAFSAGDGSRFEVDLLRRDPEGPPGLGNTPTLSLYLRNTASRDAGEPSPTNEAQGLAVMALADELARRTADGTTLPGLMTLRERQAQQDAPR